MLKYEHPFRYRSKCVQFIHILDPMLNDKYLFYYTQLFIILLIADQQITMAMIKRQRRSQVEHRKLIKTQDHYQEETYPENEDFCSPKNIDEHPRKSEILNCQDTIQQQGMLIYNLYQRIFGFDEIQLKYQDYHNDYQKLNDLLQDEIESQIHRLRRIQEQFDQLMKILESSSNKMTVEDKWKLVVISYRDKLAKTQTKLQEEKKARKLLEETVHFYDEEKERLAHLSNMKIKKLNALIAEKDQWDEEACLLNNTISQLQSELEEAKDENSHLSNQLQQISKVKEDLTAELEIVREQSQVYAQENYSINKQLKVLGEEQESINKQILDLKIKYETEIAILENSISMMTIEKQEYLMVIEQYERVANLGSRKVDRIDVETQTEIQKTVACFFNSLAEEIDDQSFGSDELKDEKGFHHLSSESDHQQMFSDDQNEQKRAEDLDQAEPNQNQGISMKGGPPDRENLNKTQILYKNEEMSFDLGERSFLSNNEESRYLQSVNKLSSSLVEAYQKINQLTHKVQELEGEKIKAQHALKQKQEKTKVSQKRQEKGYFSSFFKK